MIRGDTFNFGCILAALSPQHWRKTLTRYHSTTWEKKHPGLFVFQPVTIIFGSSEPSCSNVHALQNISIQIAEGVETAN